MADLALDPLENILRQCEAAAPEPWYPKLFAEAAGVARDSLDAPLETLRLAGLIRLTDWVQGRGQGYVLTPEGTAALQEPRILARVREGKPIRKPEPIRPAPQVYTGATTWERGERIRQAFIDPPFPVVTRIILFVYVAVFLFGAYLAQQRNLPLGEYFAGSPKDDASRMKYFTVLNDLGAVNGLVIVEGKWWRLLTCCFVHIGLLHIGLNSWALWALGKFLEPLWGKWRFVVIYLVAGIGGSCVALMTSIQTMAGGSGALCGMLGTEAAWLFLNRAYLPPQLFSALRTNLLLNTFLLVGISMVPGVSWGAHLGGAIAGAIVAFFLHFHRDGRGLLRWLALVGVILTPVAFVGALVYTMSTNPTWQKLRAQVEWLSRVRESENLRQRFHDEVWPVAIKAKKLHDRVYQDLLNLHPDRRDPEKKQAALNDLAEIQQELQEAEERFSAGPVSTDTNIQEAKKQALSLLQSELELCALAEQDLKENRNVLGEEEQKLDQLANQVQELLDACRQTFHPGQSD